MVDEYLERDYQAFKNDLIKLMLSLQLSELTEVWRSLSLLRDGLFVLSGQRDTGSELFIGQTCL